MRRFPPQKAQLMDHRVFNMALRSMLVLVPIVLAFVWVQAVSANPTATEDSGQDLYKRGFYEEALAEWKRAVEEGQDAGAAFRLAEEYFDAKVVSRDIPQSIRYLKIGAEGGDHRAQMDLGSRYDDGIGVEKDPVQAAKWFEASARQGNAAACYNIATMYQDGTGVEKDLEKAYMYYLLAIDFGFPPLATTQIDVISPEMSPEQIKRATLAAREFREAREDTDAE